MKIRNGFVSNSSSASFVIPKKLMSEEDLEIYDEYRNDYNFSDLMEDDLHATNQYIFGQLSMHNKELNRIFKKYIGMEGVDYES